MSEASEKTEVISGNTLFATHLFQELAKTNDGNILFSPLSIHTLLSLIYQGSGGNTQKALAEVLNIPETKERSAQGYKEIMSDLNSVTNVTLHIANKIFLKDSLVLKSSFQTLATDNFFAEAEKVNIGDAQGTSNTINSWVEGKTNKKIRDLITPDMIDPLTAMILVNAIYFKGNWAKQFRKELTRKEKFHVSATESIDVDMMHQESNFRYGESSELDAKILELPYENKQLSMFIILPNKVDGIKELEQKLGNIQLNDLFTSVRSVKVNVALPKFKIETKIDLNDILQKLGLEIIFSDEADFSGLLDSPAPLKVGKAVQKAFLEVNEEGAEAAAATGITVVGLSAFRPVVLQFIVNHPFAIILQAENKVLFVGSVYNPSSQ